MKDLIIVVLFTLSSALGAQLLIERSYSKKVTEVIHQSQIDNENLLYQFDQCRKLYKKQ